MEHLEAPETSALHKLGIKTVADAFQLEGLVVSEDRRSRMQCVSDAQGRPLFFLKTFDYRGDRRRWRYLFRASHCLREYANLILLQALGVPCPEVLGAGEERHRGRPLRAFLATGVMDGFRTLEEALRRGELNPAAKGAIAVELAAQAARMHQAGYIDRDLKFRNILLKEEDDRFLLAHVDCTQGGLRRGASFRRGVIHDLSTLNKHASRFFSDMTRMRFLLAYGRRRGLAKKELRRLSADIGRRTEVLWQRHKGEKPPGM